MWAPCRVSTRARDGERQLQDPSHRQVNVGQQLEPGPHHRAEWVSWCHLVKEPNVSIWDSKQRNRNFSSGPPGAPSDSGLGEIALGTESSWQR